MLYLARKPGDPILNTVDANVKEMVATLKRETHFSKLVDAGKLMIIGQHYNLSDGSLVPL